MFSVVENSLNLDAFYLVKLIFGKYFRYFDANCVADILQLDAIRVLVRERVNITQKIIVAFYSNNIPLILLYVYLERIANFQIYNINLNHLHCRFMMKTSKENLKQPIHTVGLPSKMNSSDTPSPC